jgi:hypothetical protein
MPTKPILLRLRQKAVHARMGPLQVHHASHNRYLKSSESEDEPDELDVFGGRTQLVTKFPKQISGPSHHTSQLASSTETQNNPPNQRKDYRLDLMNIPEVQEYEPGEGEVGLPELEFFHRELSGSLYSRSGAPSYYGPQHGQQGDLMLQDRWSSFLSDASLPQGYLSHLGPQAR